MKLKKILDDKTREALYALKHSMKRGCNSQKS